jgi:hypothetical protein
VLLYIGVLLSWLDLLGWLWDFYWGDLLWNVKRIHFGFVFENLHSPWLLSDWNFEKITELLYCYV